MHLRFVARIERFTSDHSSPANGEQAMDFLFCAYVEVVKGHFDI
jgi:hypothetical protein